MKTPFQNSQEIPPAICGDGSVEPVPASRRTPDNDGTFLPDTDSDLADTQEYIRTFGRMVPLRPLSRHDLQNGLGLADPELFSADLSRLRQAWPSASAPAPAPHLFRAACSELWGLPARRTNETLLRMRRRNWIVMMTWAGVFSYHLLPAGEALLADTLADGPDNSQPLLSQNLF